ncbi:hypothetical protein MHU86_15981 [Fragilaria crotonensis]|nr:hypothetical protein MHU86_15981 [Fragilaria crotonensis]
MRVRKEVLGKHKTRQLISEAREPGGRGRIVTKSDEAFALLMFENYIDKWKSMPPVADEAEDSDSEQGQRKKKAKPRQRGAYTRTKVGTANTVGGVMRESHDSMNFTALCRKTGNAPKQRQWRSNYWRFA